VPAAEIDHDPAVDEDPDVVVAAELKDLAAGAGVAMRRVTAARPGPVIRWRLRA